MPVSKINLECLKSVLTDRRHALLASLPENPQPALIEINIVEAQTNQLAHTEATTVEKLEDGAVTLWKRALEFCFANIVDKEYNGFRIKNLWHFLRCLRETKILGRILVCQLMGATPVKETAQRTDFTTYGNSR